MGNKSEVNAKMIAVLTGVSPSAVSMVLNNRGSEFRIAEKTRERILQTARELGYEHVAKTKRSKKKSTMEPICIFCPINFDRGPTAQFYAGFLRYITEKKLSYDVILIPFETGQLRGRARWFTGAKASGIVLISLAEDDIEFIESNDFEIPVILYNRSARGYSSILTDDYSVGYKTMTHFIKRGHKKFGLISPDYSSRALTFRMMGYLDRFNSYNFKTGEAFLLPAACGDDSDTGGYQAMEALLRADPIPTAVFIPSDNMVGGIVRCIRDKGLRIPHDIELISYGDKPVNSVVSPSVSSYATPVDEMSYYCAKTLHELIAGSAMTDNVKLSFEAKCIFRDSSPETL